MGSGATRRGRKRRAVRARVSDRMPVTYALMPCRAAWRRRRRAAAISSMRRRGFVRSRVCRRCRRTDDPTSVGVRPPRCGTGGGAGSGDPGGGRCGGAERASDAWRSGSSAWRSVSGVSVPTSGGARNVAAARGSARGAPRNAARTGRDVPPDRFVRHRTVIDSSAARRHTSSWRPNRSSVVWNMSCAWRDTVPDLRDKSNGVRDASRNVRDTSRNVRDTSRDVRDASRDLRDASAARPNG